MNISIILRFLEKLLIACLFVGMLIFFFNSFGLLISMDWSESDTYFFLIRRILALAIGIELVRFIYTYEIDTLLEILIFLIARQLILMEVDHDYTHLLSAVIAISIFISLRILLKKIEMDSRKTDTTKTLT